MKTLVNKRRTTSLFVVGVVLLAGLAACGSSSTKTSSATANLPSGQPGKGKPTIIMGDKNFAEEYILGDLYTQALQAEGYTVDLKANIGSSEIVETALTSGKIDMYPEYTGVIYTELANLGNFPKSAQITLQGATQWEAGKGFTVLKPTPFQDADGVAVTKAYGAKYGLKTIGDLSKVGTFTYGGPPENATRFQGVLGLQSSANGGYGLSKLQFVPLAIGAQYQALDTGKVNSIAIFTTDGQLLSGKYDVLTDTKGIFGFQNVVPVVANKFISEEGPDFSKILNDVSAKLSYAAIQQMNLAVSIDQKDPATVAAAFLKANGLG